MLQCWVLVLFVKPMVGRQPDCLFLWPPTTCMVFVAASLEEMTRGEETQQNYKYYQGDRWEDGHAESWSGKLAHAIGFLAHTLCGFAVCLTPRRLPLRAATHMNATLHPQRAYRRTTDRISNSESWRDEGMARRYAIRPDRNASGSRLMARSLPSACL